MIEPNYGVGFLLKPPQALGVAGKAQGQKFERGFAARDNVGGQIDFAHPASAYRFGNFVVAESSGRRANRSEEHTSELQSQSNLVCRLLLEKKKNKLSIIHEHSRSAALYRLILWWSV